MARCPTCGYPLKNGKCDACGNSYESIDAKDGNGTFTLHLGNEAIRCYLARVEAEVISESIEYMTIDGHYGRTKPVMQRKFIFMEC